MAPTTAGTNCLTQSEDWLVERVANCSAFQTWTGTATVTAAKTHIYLHDIPQKKTTDGRDYHTEAETAALYPLVLITDPTDGAVLTRRATARGTGASGDTSSAFSLRFEAIADADSDNQQARRLFNNAVGDIIDEMDVRNETEVGEYEYSTLTIVGTYRLSDDMTTELGDVIGMIVEVTREVTQ